MIDRSRVFSNATEHQRESRHVPRDVVVVFRKWLTCGCTIMGGESRQKSRWVLVVAVAAIGLLGDQARSLPIMHVNPGAG